MKHLASLSRGALGTLLAIHLVGACGGQSFTAGEGEGGSGSHAGTTGSGGKAGSSSHAGSSSTAGKSTTGGAPGAGGSGTAGTVSTSGAPGTGGAPPVNEACTAPAETGNCEAAIPRWFHDPSTGLCRPFTYGGCGGNANNYRSLAECQDACHGGAPNYDACTQPSECVISSSGCCDVCDSPYLSEHDFLAYNRQHTEEVLGCAALDSICGACPPVMGGTRKYFVPTCEAGACGVDDLRTSGVTACKLATDCRLRYGSGCCEGCGGEPIAVRSDGSFEELVCGDAPQACPPCLPVPPVNAQAVCNAGRCQVAYVGGTTN